MYWHLNHINFESLYIFGVHYYLYDLACNSINEQCGTDVHSPLPFSGLPDFLSDSKSAICSIGNRTTFVFNVWLGMNGTADVSHNGEAGKSKDILFK